MFITIDIKRVLSVILITLLSAGVIIGLVLLFDVNEADDVFCGIYGRTLVIDPGHGGIDGGAVSASGLKESDVNLAIALKTEAIARFCGVYTVMTRSTDTDNSDGSYSEHNNLLRRAELANSIDNAVLISIHQNTFPTSNVRGAEVMYSDTAGSMVLGELTQNNLAQQADPENRRVAIPAPKSLLLTSSVHCPAILVECGFLSNPDEALRLATDKYQTKIAAVLAASYIQFCME